MSADEKRKRLAFAIAEFLQSQQESFADEDKRESIGIAVDCINNAFGIDVNDQAQKTLYSIHPVSLPSIFNVYLNRADKKTEETPKAAPKQEPTVQEPKDAPTEAERKMAEEKKQNGNKMVADKDYTGAIKAYSEAIELDDTNPIYFSNRAAAYSQNGDHDMAVDDARRAIQLDPKYAKAYSRLGHAFYCLERYQESVEAYEKGLKIEPDSKPMKEQLAKAKQAAGIGASTSSSGAAGGGLGGLGGLASLLGGGGGGGMPDLAGMMNNPMLQQAAEMMRNNPQMMQNIMSNPMFQQMAQGMMGRGGGAPGGGGGGMPDISSLMSNPDLMNAAASLFGGSSGSGGSGRGSGTGSSE